MNTVAGRLRSEYRFLNPLRSAPVLLAVVVGASNLCLAGGGSLAQERPQEKPAEQQFKNIKVFQGLPASQLIPAMSYMRVALGVQCSYCHMEREFDKDGKEEKEQARKMIIMMRDINQTNFGGRTEVTCNTCHRGQPHPVSLPALADLSGKALPPRSAPERRAMEPLPGVDQIFETYVQAIGGKSVLEKVKTRIMKGARMTSEGGSAPIEIYQQAPNRMVAIYKLASPSSTGYDGTIGWNQTDRGVREIDGPNLMRLKREAEISRGLNLRDEYQNLRVIGKQPVGDREAYVVQGTTTGDHRLERLFFDVQSGLLLRISSREPTPLGPLPEETEFDDYRDVSGIKLPFTVIRMGADRSYKDIYSEITQDVPIENTRFEKPASPR